MLGRCTLTATSPPPYASVSTARWTCATDAAPSGASSNSAKTSEKASSAWSSSRQITERTSLAGIGSSMSVMPDSLSVYWRGKRSCREAMIWPTLTGAALVLLVPPHLALLVAEALVEHALSKLERAVQSQVRADHREHLHAEGELALQPLDGRERPRKIHRVHVAPGSDACKRRARTRCGPRHASVRPRLERGGGEAQRCKQDADRHIARGGGGSTVTPIVTPLCTHTDYNSMD
eukprot:519474-Prymnesium_polylepis.2